MGHLGIEVERKWLVDKKDLTKIMENYDPWKVKQGYLNKGDLYTIRYRSVNDKDFWLEIKSKGDLTREEYRYEISRIDFNTGFSKCKHKISKLRYMFMDGPHKLEIDVYDDYDFCTVEIEFLDELEAEKFVAPKWFGRDVTYESEYKNLNLAK